jgi:GTP-binding protein HflX
MGGIGGRGPGETKLEIDRRRAKDRIADLERRLSRLRRQRDQRRARRRRSGVPVVAIVGYTNAGKSTLLNVVTNSDVGTEDKLFATLDPTVRRIRFPHDREVVLLDTVGFIRELPAALKQAFSATLEEVTEADLLLHVIDATDPDQEQQCATVESILGDLGAGQIPRLMVLNKCDLLDPALVRERAQKAPQDHFFLSALDRRSTRELMLAIQDHLWERGRVDRPGRATTDPLWIPESDDSEDLPEDEDIGEAADHDDDLAASLERAHAVPGGPPDLEP